MFNSKTVAAALGALAIAVALPAQADSQTVTTPYLIEFGPGQLDTFGYLQFDGMAQVALPEFSGQNLQKVTLRLDSMKFWGEVEVLDLIEPAETPLAIVDGAHITAHFSGRAEAPGGLVAMGTFPDFMSNGALPIVDDTGGGSGNGFVEIDVADLQPPGPGMDMTSSGLGPYEGTGDVPVDVYASVNVGYENITETGTGSFQAFGDVSLIYEFEGDEVIIPTPSAIAGGLMGLCGLGLAGLRRRA